MRAGFRLPIRTLALVTLVAFAGNSAASETDAKQAVRCAEIRFSESAENRNIEQFEAFIHPDARFIGQTVLHGPESIVAAWAVFFQADGPAIRWRPEFVEVLESGDLAMTRGPYLVTSVDANGAENHEWGVFNSVWKRSQDANWKVAFDAGMPGNGEMPQDLRAVLDAATTGC
ncbi:MAG: nuclear transport factor 2 family protein [Woeseiaceae bacterium]|nr:nuclear transport factor 2 family protein [Woeseiaceae bacterium]